MLVVEVSNVPISYRAEVTLLSPGEVHTLTLYSPVLFPNFKSGVAGA